MKKLSIEKIQEMEAEMVKNGEDMLRAACDQLTPAMWLQNIVETKQKKGCPHCGFLSDRFFIGDNKSPREYWLMTEMFVYLHRGDVCNFSKKGKTITKTPVQIITDVIISAEKSYDYHPSVRMDLVIESMHQYAEIRVEIAQTYWAERFQELIDHVDPNTDKFDKLVEEMKTAKYFP